MQRYKTYQENEAFSFLRFWVEYSSYNICHMWLLANLQQVKVRFAINTCFYQKIEHLASWWSHGRVF